MTTRLPTTPYWHPDRDNGARAEVVSAIVTRLSPDTHDRWRVERAVRDALDGWGFAYERGRVAPEHPMGWPFDGEGDPADTLRIVAISPERGFTDAEHDALGAAQRRQVDRSAFRTWVRLHADAGLSAPEFPREDVDMVALITRQRTWWFTGDGRWLRLVDMEPSHRRATLSGLRKRARSWLTSYSLSLGALPDDVPDPLETEDPEQWIEEQPLVAALAGLVMRDRGRQVPDVRTPIRRRRRPRAVVTDDAVMTEDGTVVAERVPGSDAFVLPTASPMARHKAGMADLRQRLDSRETLD